MFDITSSQLLLFISVTLVLTVTPGVDTFLIVRNVLRGGCRDGVITGVGICSGLLVHATLSVLGISLVLVRSAAVFNCVKLAGAAYLIWLGLSGIIAAARGNGHKHTMSDAATRGNVVALRSLREGLLSNLLNPKSSAFFLAFFPQFIQHGDHVLQKSMVLVAIQVTMGMAWLALLSLMLSRANSLFARSAVRRRLAALSGVVLIALGLRLCLERR